MIDTDVVAAAVLEEAGRADEAAGVLASAADLMAPSHWRAEFANVVWKAILQGRLDLGSADLLLLTAGALPITTVDVHDLSRGAIARAVEARHPVYDALFVELAVREGTLVVSYDVSFRQRFADRVRHPSEILAGRART